jgi:uncharacterized caspase-like protein
MLRQSVGVLLCILALGSANLHAAERVALVIGNGAYKHISALKNPPKDVRLISNSLIDIGFNVTTLIDADVDEMESAVKKFKDKLNDSGKDTIGLFYFAGHGITYDGANYLIPVEAKIEEGPDLRRRALPASWVLEIMEAARNATNIMILDACRNNPFKGLSLSGTRSLTSGMVRMTAPEGSLVGFSTAEGRVAYDGDGGLQPVRRGVRRRSKDT